MEADAGRQVEVRVGVMHGMQAGEHRHRVEQYMLEVDDQVEEHRACKHGQPVGQVEAVEQSPTFVGGERREGQRRTRQHYPQDYGVHDREAEIGAPAREPGQARGAGRGRPFPQCERREHRPKHAQAKGELAVRRDREAHGHPYIQLSS